MGLYAIIDSNVVHNIATGDDAFAASISAYHQVIVAIDVVTPQPRIGWSYDAGTGLFAAPTIPLSVLIDQKIAGYQAVAPKLLRQIYVTNTLSGITTDQSDAMFDLFDDVIARLMQGAFPTALYRLLTKTPSGFVTQPMLDNFVAAIKTFL
jgi:hypothetical protein